MELLYVLSHVNYEHKIKQNHFKATVSSVNYKPYNRSMLCVTNVWWHSTQLAKSLGKCGWQLRGTSVTAPPWHIHCKYHYLIISLLSSRTGCPPQNSSQSSLPESNHQLLTSTKYHGNLWRIPATKFFGVLKIATDSIETNISLY